MIIDISPITKSKYYNYHVAKTIDPGYIATHNSIFNPIMFLNH